jgi:hypothetical protein
MRISNDPKAAVAASRAAGHGKSKYKAPMDQTAARDIGTRMASHGINRNKVASMSVINND